MGRESSLQRTCRAIAVDRGAFGIRLNPINGAGVPDYAFCYRGLFCAWEFKQPRDGTRAGRRKLQEHVQNEIRAAGGRVSRIDHPDQARAFLDELDRLLVVETDPRIRSHETAP